MPRKILTWKYAIAVVVILGFSVFVSHEDQKTREQYEQKCTQLNARAISPSSGYEDCDKDAENAARHLPRWYRMFGWPEGITTWAILLTLLAIAEQTAQAKRAAKAAEDAASAAEKSIQHLLASERALVIVETGVITDDFEPDPNTLQFMEIRPLIRNRGKTVARIKAVSVRAHPVAKPCDLPTDPEYKGIVPLDLLPLPPDAIIQPIKVMVDLREFVAYREGRSVLYVYGFVDYRDVADNEQQSRFCFKYVVPGGFTAAKRGFYIATDAPKKYMKST